MKKENVYISTVAEAAADCARKHGLGLEIAEYCTAFNMDELFAETDKTVQEYLKTADRFVLHAPFNELHPSAIDPRAVELAHDRLGQAVRLAADYGVHRIVMHSGYIPQLYYKIWFEERSVLFWKDFLKEQDETLLICLENVWEDEAELLCRIVEAVDDPRFRLCLDTGHAACYSKVPLQQWVKTCAPYLAHFHVHNNAGDADTHGDLDQGVIDMEAVLQLAGELCPDATFTLETMRAQPSVDWLFSHGLLQ